MLYNLLESTGAWLDEIGLFRIFQVLYQLEFRAFISIVFGFALVLLFGFGVLYTSAFPPNQSFAVLASAVIGAALIADLWMLPALLLWFRPTVPGAKAPTVPGAPAQPSRETA